MNVFAIRLKPKCKKSSFVICLAALCALSSCQDTMPPMSEYQFVTTIPIDDVERGMLFVVDNNLYILRHTVDQYHLNTLEQYNISDPINPTLENRTCLSTPIYPWSPTATHRHHAFFFSHPQIVRVNFSTFRTHSRFVDFMVYDLAYSNQILFLNTNSGMRIWDVASWPEYIEVFCDTITRSNGRTAVFDTILCEFYRKSGFHTKYAFWNINVPHVISEGDWFYNIGDIGMNEDYLIHSTGYTIRRFSLASYDTLVFEDSAEFGDIDDFVLLDSLIYLRNNHAFTVVVLKDFNDYVKTSLITGFDNPPTRDLAVYEDAVFILAFKRGIMIFERREQ